jgi:hypothetical protein
MSGFLKTLARRVMQTDAPIRPRTNLPFAGPAASLESKETITALRPAVREEGNVVSNPGETMEVGNRRPDETRRRRLVETPVRRESPLGDETHASTMLVNTEELEKSDKDSDTPPYETHAQTEVRREFEPLVQPVLAPEQQAAVRRDPARVTVEVTAGRARPNDEIVAQRIRRELHRSEIGFRNAHGEPPEVHVSIGRIELTAATPPSAPKRTRDPARKPMSLEEYLERRAGEKR